MPAGDACEFCISNAHSRNALQRTATDCNTLRHTTARIKIASFASYASEAHSCNTLQHAVTRCSTLQHAAARCITLHHAATHCNALQHTHRHTLHLLQFWPSQRTFTTHYNTLYHAATQHTLSHCNTPQDTHTLHLL